MKRDDPTLRMTQWTPAADALSVDFDAEERALLRAEGGQERPDLTGRRACGDHRELADPATPPGR